MPCGEHGIFYAQARIWNFAANAAWGPRGGQGRKDSPARFGGMPVPAGRLSDSRNRGDWANRKSCGCRNWIYCNEEALRMLRILLYFLLCNEETYSMILQAHDCIRLYNDIGYPAG